MATNEIIPPEPPSNGPDAWTYLPRWLQVLLVLALIAVAGIILVFVK